jgi:hypothetical protein
MKTMKTIERLISASHALPFLMSAAMFVSLFTLTACCSTGIDWAKAKEIRPGVHYVHRELTEPRLMKAFMIRVDLQTPGIRFTGPGRDPLWGEQMPDVTNRVCLIRTKRQRTRDFMLEQRRPKSEGGKGRDLVVAVNTEPWGPWEEPFTHKYANPYSPLISDGEVVSTSGTGGGAVFVVYTNGVADITSHITSEQTPQIWCAQTGFNIIMRNGEDITKPGGALAPRTAFGLSKDRRWLYLLAVDGRQPDYSLGADMHDVVAIMKDAGAWDAMNMDGGGSTTLVYWDDAAKKPVVCNRQTESGYTRPVGANMGIYFE